MSRLLVAGGRMAVVTRDVREDSEQYWDRSWSFAVGVARGREPEAAWAESLKRPHERRGAVYSDQ